MQSRIIDFSEQNPRYGYRRVTALLRREGAKINTKRVQRVRRQESLQVRKKQRRTKRLGMSTAMRQRAERANQIWSWDFVHDQTQEGRPYSSLGYLTPAEFAEQQKFQSMQLIRHKDNRWALEPLGFN